MPVPLGDDTGFVAWTAESLDSLTNYVGFVGRFGSCTLPDVDKILCKFPGIERPGKATCENAACCHDVDLGANACYKPAVREHFS